MRLGTLTLELSAPTTNLQADLRRAEEYVKAASRSFDMSKHVWGLAASLESEMRAARSIFNSSLKSLESDAKGYEIKFDIADGFGLEMIRAEAMLDRSLREMQSRVKVRKLDLGDFDISGIEAKIAKINGLSITPRVDDRQLTSLNAHLTLKEQHLDRVVSKFANTPIVPLVDDRQLTQLNQQLAILDQRIAGSRTALAVPTQIPGLDGGVREMRVRMVIDDQQLRQRITVNLDINSSELSRSVEDSIKKGFKGAKASGGNLLDVVTSVPRTILRGFQEGIGVTYAKSLTQGTIRGLEEQFGSSLDRVGKGIGDRAGRAGKVIGNGLVQRAGFSGTDELKGKIGELNEAFVDLFPTGILEKKLKRIEDRLMKIIDNASRFRPLDEQVQAVTSLGSAIGELQEVPKQGIKNRRAKQIQKNAEEIKKSGSGDKVDIPEGTHTVIIASGGFAGQQGKSSGMVGKKLQSLMGKGYHVISVDNVNTDVSMPLQEAGVPRWLAEGGAKIVKNKLIDGVNPDAVASAKLAYQIEQQYPGINMRFAGFSAGGLIANDATEQYQATGKKAQGIAIGSPIFANSANQKPDTFSAVLREGDGVNKVAKKIKQATGIGLDGKVTTMTPGDGHELALYLSEPKSQRVILDRLGGKDEPLRKKSAADFDVINYKEQAQQTLGDLGYQLANPIKDSKVNRLLLAQKLAAVKETRSSIKKSLPDAQEQKAELIEYLKALNEANSLLSQVLKLPSIPVIGTPQPKTTRPESTPLPSPQVVNYNPFEGADVEIASRRPARKLQTNSNPVELVNPWDVEIQPQKPARNRRRNRQKRFNLEQPVEGEFVQETSGFQEFSRSIKQTFRAGAETANAIAETAKAGAEGAKLLGETAKTGREAVKVLGEAAKASSKIMQLVGNVADAAGEGVKLIGETASTVRAVIGGVGDSVRSITGRDNLREIEGSDDRLQLPGQMRTIQAMEGDDPKPLKQINGSTRLALPPSDDLRVSKDYIKNVEQVFAQKKAAIYKAIEAGDLTLINRLKTDYKASITKLEQEIQTGIEKGDKPTKEFYNSGGIKSQLAHKKRFAQNIDVAADLIESNADPIEIKQAQIVSDANLRKLTAKSILKRRENLSVSSSVIDVQATPIIDEPTLRTKQKSATAIVDLMVDRKLKIEKAIEDGDLELIKQHKQELNNLIQDGKDLIKANPTAVNLKTNFAAQLGTKQKFLKSTETVTDLLQQNSSSDDVDRQVGLSGKLKKSTKLGLKARLISSMLGNENTEGGYGNLAIFDKLRELGNRDIPQLSFLDRNPLDFAKGLFGKKAALTNLGQPIEGFRVPNLGQPIEGRPVPLGKPIEGYRAADVNGVSQETARFLALRRVPDRDNSAYTARLAQEANQREIDLFMKLAFPYMKPPAPKPNSNPIAAITVPPVIDPSYDVLRVLKANYGINIKQPTPAPAPRPAAWSVPIPDPWADEPLGKPIAGFRVANLGNPIPPVPNPIADPRLTPSTNLPPQSKFTPKPDGMLPVGQTRQIENDINNKSLYEVSPAARRFDRAYDRANRNIDKSLEQSAKGIGQELERINNPADKAKSSLDNLKGSVFGIVRGFGFLAVAGFAATQLSQFAVSAFTASNTSQQLDRSLKFATGSSGAGQSLRKKASGEAYKYGIDLNNSIDTDAKFAGGVKGTAFEGAPTAYIATAFKEGSAVRGLNSEQQKNAQIAITQMLGKGQIYAEELKGQLAESGFSDAIPTLAKSLNMSPAQLNQVMKNGEGLDSSAILKFATQLKVDAQSNLPDATSSAPANLARLNNAGTELQQKFGDSFMAPANTGIAALGTTAKFAADNFGIFGAIMLRVGLVDGGRFLMSLAPIRGGLMAIGEVGLKGAIGGLASFGKSFAMFGLETAAAVVGIEAFKLAASGLQIARGDLSGSPLGNLATENTDQLKQIEQRRGNQTRRTDSPDLLKNDAFTPDNLLAKTADSIYGGLEAVGLRTDYYGYRDLNRDTAIQNIGKITGGSEPLVQGLKTAANPQSISRLKDIDKEIALIQAQRSVTKSSEGDKLKSLNDREGILTTEKIKVQEPITTAQSDISAKIGRLKSVLESPSLQALEIENPTAGKTARISAALELKNLEKELAAVSKQLNASSDRVRELGLQFSLLNGKLGQSLQAIERTGTETRSKFIATANPSNTGYNAATLKVLEQKQINETIKARQLALAEVTNQLSQPQTKKVTDVLLKSRNTTLQAVSPEQIAELQGVAENSPEQKAALARLAKYVELRSQIAGSSEQLITSRSEFNKQLVAENKEIRQYYLGLQREVSPQQSFYNAQIAAITIGRNKFIEAITGFGSSLGDGFFGAITDLLDTSRIKLEAEAAHAAEIRGIIQNADDQRTDLKSRSQNSFDTQTPQSNPIVQPNIKEPIYQQSRNGLIIPVAGAKNSRGGGYPEDMGLDIMTPVHTPIVSVGAGKLIYAESGHVKQAGEDSDPLTPGHQKQHSVKVLLDKPVRYNDKDYKYAYYTHMTDLNPELANRGSGSRTTAMRQPTRVEAGQFLGRSGTAGGGPHLHFSLATDENLKDHLDYRQTMDVLFGTKETSNKAVATGLVSPNRYQPQPTSQPTSFSQPTVSNTSTSANASTFHPGGGGMQGAELDARGKRLTANDYAIAIPGQNKVKDQIPYGSTVELNYKGRQIKAKVVDGGPYVPGRQMDITTATAKALKFDGVGQISVQLVELPKGADPNKDYYFGEATYRPKFGKNGSITNSEAQKAVSSVVQGDKSVRLRGASPSVDVPRPIPLNQADPQAQSRDLLQRANDLINRNERSKINTSNTNYATTVSSNELAEQIKREKVVEEGRRAAKAARDLSRNQRQSIGNLYTPENIQGSQFKEQQDLSNRIETTLDSLLDAKRDLENAVYKNEMIISTLSRKPNLDPNEQLVLKESKSRLPTFKTRLAEIDRLVPILEANAKESRQILDRKQARENTRTITNLNNSELEQQIQFMQSQKEGFTQTLQTQPFNQPAASNERDLELRIGLAQSTKEKNSQLIGLKEQLDNGIIALKFKDFKGDKKAAVDQYYKDQIAQIERNFDSKVTNYLNAQEQREKKFAINLSQENNQVGYKKQEQSIFSLDTQIQRQEIIDKGSAPYSSNTLIEQKSKRAIDQESLNSRRKLDEYQTQLRNYQSNPVLQKQVQSQIETESDESIERRQVIEESRAAELRAQAANLKGSKFTQSQSIRRSQLDIRRAKIEGNREAGNYTRDDEFRLAVDTKKEEYGEKRFNLQQQKDAIIGVDQASQQARDSFQQLIDNLNEAEKVDLSNLTAQFDPIQGALKDLKSSTREAFGEFARTGNFDWKKMLRKPLEGIIDKSIDIGTSALFNGIGGFFNTSRPDTKQAGDQGVLGMLTKFLGGIFTGKFAEGGVIGDGRSKADDQLILAQRGEGIITHRGMDLLGARGLRLLNRGMSPLPKFATGGVVGSLNNISMNLDQEKIASSGNNTVNMSIDNRGQVQSDGKADQKSLQALRAVVVDELIRQKRAKTGLVR